jgi:hypothetical protein
MEVWNQASRLPYVIQIASAVERRDPSQRPQQQSNDDDLNLHVSAVQDNRGFVMTQPITGGGVRAIANFNLPVS